MPDLLRVLILGIVEGITEFLPVSSTGHMLLVERWMRLPKDDEFWKTFTVVIQIGAILAVVVYFRRRIVTLLRESLAPGKLPAPAGAGSPAEDLEPVRPRNNPVLLILLGTLPVLVVGF